MAAIRRITVVAVAALISAGGLLAPAAAQTADEREVHETSVEIDYLLRAARFVGTISSSFTAEGSEAPDCLAGRQVTIQFRRADGTRRAVGTTLTDETGSFRLRAALRKGVYFAHVEATEFAYSPSYGRLVEVVCAAGSGRMRSTRTRVLGVLVERGATEATRTGTLPFTGWDASRGVGLVPLGVGLIVLGTTALTLARRRPGRRTPEPSS